MSVVRVRRKYHFTQLSNATLRDDGLSLQAKGLLAVMLSYPDNWAYNLKHLEGRSANGRDAHRSALRELITAGYAEWQTVHDDSGKLKGRELVVCDEPTFEAKGEDRGPEKPSHGNGTVGLETRRTEKPSDGKPAPTKNDFTKTDLTKTEEEEEEDRASSLMGFDEQEPLMRLQQTDHEAHRTLSRLGGQLGWKFRHKNLAAAQILRRRDAALAALALAHKKARGDAAAAYSLFESILDNPQPQHRRRAPAASTHRPRSTTDTDDLAARLKGDRKW